MPACRVGCCQEAICTCPTYCECLLPDDDPKVALKTTSDDCNTNVQGIMPGTRTACQCKWMTAEQIKDAAEMPEDISSNANSAEPKTCCSQEEGTAVDESCCSSKNAATKSSDDTPSTANQAEQKKCCSQEEGTAVQNGCCSSENTSTTKSSEDISNNANAVQPKKCCSEDKTTVNESCCSSKNATTESSEDISSIPNSVQPKKCCSQKDTTTAKDSCCSSKNATKSSEDILPAANSAEPKKCCSQKETTAVEDDNCCSTKKISTKSSEDISFTANQAEPKKCCSQEETTSVKDSCCSDKNITTESSEDISATANQAEPKSCCGQEETTSVKDSCCSSKNITTESSEDISATANQAEPKSCCGQEETTSVKDSCCSSKNITTESSEDISANQAEPKSCCGQEDTTTVKESCCSSKNVPADDSSISAAKPEVCCADQEPGESCCSTNEGTATNPPDVDPSPSQTSLHRGSSREIPAADVTSQPQTYDVHADSPAGDAESLLPAEDNKATKLDIEVPRVQTTKLRAQNICCPKESYIAEEVLRKFAGVHTVRVNAIGRVVYVSHNPDLVSPTELAVALNKRHLGASIVDTGAAEDVDSGLPRDLKILIAFLAIQVVLLAIALAAMFTNESWYMWVSIVEICFGIIPVLKKCLHAIRNRTIDLNILITLTVIGTLVIQEWIEGAAVVFVFTLANFLQQYCFYRVHKTVSSLMLSKPSNAVIASTGECVSIEKVLIGSIIAVRQGELIPLDGVVVKGSASVDESSITGEAVPVAKTLQSQTYSGTVIQHGYLEIETTSSSTTSTMSKISTMVEEAQTNVSPTELMVNKFAKYYTPLVVLLAALVFLIPMILGVSGVDAYEGAIKTWGERALIVMVTACPCALLMATPIVVICGISGAARLGTLIKGGTFLEALSQMTFLAFDKTGTLTEGKFQVVDIVAMDASKERDVLRGAAALESKSSHPLAAAVVIAFTGECIADFSEDPEVILPDVKEFRTLEAQGISGVVEGHLVHVGNMSLLKKLGVGLPPHFDTAYKTFCAQSKTVVFVCVDKELALMISLADIIREESYVALRWLQDLGVELTMLTGDSKLTATAVQQELKLDSIVSEMKPDDKLEWIAQTKTVCEPLRKRRCFRKKTIPIVGMVGDGVNDGPALAAADVGVAMAAAGSALAVEAAGVALMTNSVLKVPEMICLSRFCRRLIFQNIVISVLLKVVFVVVALSGFVRVWMAVLADLVGLVVVIVNGLRPLKWEPPQSRKRRSPKDVTSSKPESQADSIV